MTDVLYANVYPHIPKESNLDQRKASQLKDGMSLYLDIDDSIRSDMFNAGYRDIKALFKHQSFERPGYQGAVIPPIWMLAHLYLESESSVNFFKDGNLVATTSERDATLDSVYILHHNVPCNGLQSCQVVVPVTSKNYPKGDTSLRDFIERYPKAAQALFFMNEEQLGRLKHRIPSIEFDSEMPAVQGAGFVDSKRNRGWKPYLFGSRKNEKNLFFGVTTIEYVPVITYPANVGKLNEIPVAFSASEYLELTSAFDALTKSKKTQRKVERLQKAILAPLRPL